MKYSNVAAVAAQQKRRAEKQKERRKKRADAFVPVFRDRRA